MAILSNPLSNAFGLDIGDRSFKLVQARKKAGRKNLSKITAWGEIDVPEGVMERGEIQDMDKAVELIKKLVHGTRGKVRGRAAVVCLPEAKSFIKIIKIEGTDDDTKTLHAAVIEEIKQNIPIPLNEIYFDWQIVDRTESTQKEEAEEKPEGDENTEDGTEEADKDAKEEKKEETNDDTEGDTDTEAEGEDEPKETPTTTILLGAAPKDLVDSYSKMLELAGLVPIVLEIEATAVTRAIVPADRMHDVSLGILDIGATRSSLVIYDQGALQMSISIPVSGIEITRIVSESLDITEEEAEELKKECGLDVKICGDKMWNVLLPVIDDMTDRIRNALRFYQIGFPDGKKIERIYLCGGGAHFKEIDTVLSRKLTMKTRLANSLVNVDPKLPRKFPKEKTMTYTTAIGLALRAAEEHVKQKRTHKH